MPRTLRLEYPGAVYHVLNRGNYRNDIFREDGARLAFLACLGEACERTGWVVHAWCVMSNHYHLAVETPEPNLVAGMQWLQGPEKGVMLCPLPLLAAAISPASD